MGAGAARMANSGGRDDGAAAGTGEEERAQAPGVDSDIASGRFH